MSLEMVYLQIIGLKTELMLVIRALRRIGCVQVESVSNLPEPSLPRLDVDQEILVAQETLTLQLVQVGGLLDTLGLDRADNIIRPQTDRLSDTSEELEALRLEVQAISLQLERLRDNLDLLPRFEETMQRLLPILPASAHQPDSVSFGLLVNRNHEQILDVVQQIVSDLTGGQAEMVTGDIGGSIQAMLIVAPQEFAPEIGELLDQEDISRLRLPSDFANAPPDQAIAALRHRLLSIPDEIAAAENKLEQIAEQWGDKLRFWHTMLQDEFETCDVLSQLGQTGMTFILVGWVPSRDFENVERTLREEVGDHVLVEQLSLTEESRKRAPVALNNPTALRPFESLVNLFSTPRYQGIDPTQLMGIFLPLFFGLMLGDVGYGIIILGASLLMRRRLKGMLRDLATILAIGSSWAILFGLLFGEVFGTLGEHFGLHPLWFDRADPDHLIDLFLLTISIGVAHITLGLIIGVWESLRMKNKGHLMERGGRLIGLVSLFMLIGILVDFLPEGFMTPVIAGLVVGVTIMAIASGKTGPIIAPIEFISLIGNVLSYLRIAAIGLSSVYLAVIANEIAGAVGNVVVGGIIAVLLHILNILLGAFSPSIQSLRLHYVEFYRTFYEGGGKLYEPFKSRIDVL